MIRHNVILPLEGLAGSSVQDIARDMIATAKRLDIAVSLNMNGTRLLAFPNSTMAEIKADYEAQLGNMNRSGPRGASATKHENSRNLSTRLGEVS